MTEKQELEPTDASKEDPAMEMTAAQEAVAFEESHAGHPVLDGVEEEVINVGFVMGIVLGTVVIVAGLVLFGFTLTEVTSRDIRTRVLAETTYPELREARASAAGRLTQFGVVDQALGVYRIPFDRAIDLMVNEQFQNGGAGDYSDELRLLPPN